MIRYHVLRPKPDWPFRIAVGILLAFGLWLLGAVCSFADPPLPWPEPCRDAGTCWLKWDPPSAEDMAAGRVVTYYEIVSGDQLCWRNGQGRQITRRDGTTFWMNPRNVAWPNPSWWCWQEGVQREYQIIACNDSGCSPQRSEPVVFGPQQWRCFESSGEVPCPREGI